MKILELTPNAKIKAEEQVQATDQQAVILTWGNKPVAALLPMADKLEHLAQFDQVIQSEENVTLTIGGRPVAIIQPQVTLVLIETEETDLKSVSLSTNPQFLKLIERSRQRHEIEGGISSEEMRRRLGLQQ